jgi:V8-like Glu-specific endopeptidase
MWSKALVSVALLLSTVVGCAAEPGADEDMGGSASAIIDEKQDGDPTDFPEVVQVLVNNAAKDYCTGVLVSPTQVLTAAHCAGTSYTIIAPFAPGKPQAAATRGKVAEHSKAFNEEVGKEDAAILNLKTPINIARYATLEEVGELGTKKLKGIAVGRAYEDRNAPLKKSVTLTIRSGTEEGYTTGLGSEYYSSGGDSGGPLFLIENGKPTHTVIAIERQPDPENNSEWFTRITPKVSALLK